MYKQFCFKIKLLIKRDPGFYCNSFIVNLKYFTSKCYSFTLEMIFLLSRNIRYIFGQKNPMQCLYIVLSKINLWKNWSVHVFSWKLNFIYLIILAFPKLTIFSKARTSEDHSRNNCSKGASPRIWVHCGPTVHFIIWFVSLDYAQLNFLIN